VPDARHIRLLMQGNPSMPTPDCCAIAHGEQAEGSSHCFSCRAQLCVCADTLDTPLKAQPACAEGKTRRAELLET
jgi:hypothetical protein